MLRKAIYGENKKIVMTKGQPRRRCQHSYCRHPIYAHKPACTIGKDNELNGLFNQLPCQCKRFYYKKET